MTPLNLDRLQHWIDRGLIDPTKPITMKELFETRCVHGIKHGVKLLADVGRLPSMFEKGKKKEPWLTCDSPIRREPTTSTPQACTSPSRAPPPPRSKPSSPSPAPSSLATKIVSLS